MSYQTEIRQVFFSNLLALGFEPNILERKWKIPFNKDMFALPNKKGFEIVMHFLFNRLNAAMCQEQFKTCWPVIDKKHEQQFRKVCRDWLQTIAADDANANLPLPRIVASLFMSPGGDKMYQLFFYFSTYIVQNVLLSEIGLKHHEFLLRPVTTKQNKLMAQSMAASLKAGCSRHRHKFVEHAQESVTVQHDWKMYCSEQVKMYRMLTHDIRDLDQRIKEEVNESAEKCAARGSPRSSTRKSGMSDYDFDVQNVKRTQRIRKVRDLWRNVEESMKNLEKEREVIESILEGSQDCYNIDANQLNIRIPDLLLRECEQEIQRRSVDNVYRGGKLNLISLLNLWNLSLHLYIEKLHQCGIPNLEEVTPKITSQAHTHHAHLTNAAKFRSQLRNQLIPDLKKEIRGLRESLDSRVFHAKSPESIRMTSIGLGFMPPTPPINFSGEGVDMSGVPGHEALTQHADYASTPEAAEALMSRIDQRVKAQQQSKLVQGTPVFAGRLATQGRPTGTNTIPSSRLPVRGKLDMGRQDAVGFHGDGSMTSQKTEMTSRGSNSARKAIRSQAIHSQPQQPTNKVSRAPVSTSKQSNRSAAPREVTAKVERHAPRPRSPKALDILADEIADAVILGTPTKIYRQVIGGPSDLQDELPEDNKVGHAFISKDKLARTPENVNDKLATKLFVGTVGSDEDDGIVTLGTRTEDTQPNPASQRRHHPSGCEDESNPPAPLLGQQSGPARAPLNSPDRVKDMRLSHTTSPGGGLPPGRSFAMTSGAMVMTGDLLGMTSDDHLDATWPRTQKVNLSFDDDTNSSHSSSGDKSGHAGEVADLPDSQTYTDSDSMADSDFGILKPKQTFNATAGASRNQSNNSSSSNMRNVIGAELPSKAPPATSGKLFNLFDFDTEDEEMITDEPLPGFSLEAMGRLSLGGPAGLSPDQNGNISPSKPSNVDLNEGDDLEELVNVSARVIEIQNESYSERPEIPHSKDTSRRGLDGNFDEEDEGDLGPSPFQRNTSQRGSYRDVDQNVLKSFIQSSLQGLGHSFDGFAGGASSRLGAKSPVARSRSPRTTTQQQTIKAPNLNAADIIARYKILKESRNAQASQKAKAESLESEAGRMASPATLGGGMKTPERSNSPLNERYLQRTPTREDLPLSRRFTLNLDDQPDLTPPSARGKPSGSRLDYAKLGISPLVSPETPMPYRGVNTSTTPQRRPNPPGPTSPLNTIAGLPMSPFTEQLHKFDMNFEAIASERLSNIFDEKGPVLLPSSPYPDEPNQRLHCSPAVGRLLDI